ncbi:MAG: DUF5979 domain-containing protein [Roseburia sp.]|nr:DUF5979 domain-containing protein [Roseburia sp.]MCM1279725.1 DUF5979 domain-containing protein [Robinsoniella sp.]
MNKNRKRIFCLLAAFVLFITNSSIISVFAVEDTAKSTDTVQLESSDEAASSTETKPANTTTPAGKTSPAMESKSATEPDTGSQKSGSISGNAASGAKQDVDTAQGSAVIDLRAGAGERTIYFDATQSKVNYSGNDGQPGGKVIHNPNSIPSTANDSKVYYYAWKSTDISASTKGEMTKEASYTQGANTWKDVWSVNLDAEYDRIVFANYPNINSSNFQTGGTCTEDLTIPDANEIANPCFYADNGDQCVYEKQYANGNEVSAKRRSGIWDEAHKVTTKGNKITYTAGTTGIEVLDNKKLYVNTTFFDYFSDLELNGIDRGDVDTGSSSGTPKFNYTNRTYMTHKLFNMALSDYYGDSVVNPLYFGHFQWKWNSEGTYFKSIGSDMGLHGYSDRDQFYHNNNSEYRKDCTQCSENEGSNNHSHNTSVATQGLVDSSLSADGKLQMSGKQAPFFDEGFLKGANSYNTALGKVYPSVYFPFTKVDDYWTFDSKATNLRMTYNDAIDDYFLEETQVPIKGYTNGKGTTNSNFFPFDDADTSANVNALNYGFGMKMDINFRLTPDGTIKDEDGNSEDITFKFSGDDDIWIFIDGKLALDIGGGHGIVSGELNFKDKKATVGIKDPSDPTGNGAQSYVKTATGENNTAVKNFTLVGDNTEQHTLTMYYMERGLWESNMYISFNFPDNNVFSAEKEVDTTGIDSLFANNTNFKNNVKNLVFDLDIRNLATHYGARSVDDMNAVASGVGFIMHQESIADYGSVSSGKAEPANGARYILYERDADGSEKLVDDSADTNMTVENGIIGLKDKQLAKFTNKFRRGSYIVVTEKTSSMMTGLSGLSGTAAEQLLTDVFDTKYTICNKDAEVSKTDLQANTYWVTGSPLSSLTDQSGVVANDGREEKLVENAEDMNGTPITHTNIKEQPANAILFRNYTTPDSETVDIDLRVKYTNSFKTGAIAIKKDKAEGSADLSENTEYRFTVTFDNVAGLRLEDTWDASSQPTADNKIETTFTLKSGDTKTFTGIPAGTKYTIEEEEPSDGSTLKSVTDSLASGTVPAKVGKDTATISSANVVSGSVTADDDTSTVQTFTFYNSKEETIKTGAIAIAKAQATGSAELSENTEYHFTVTFDNISDPDWIDNLDDSYTVTGDKAQKTFTLKLGNPPEKITGIPEGTKYTIKEETPSDGSTLESVTDSLASGTVPAGVGKDTATISSDKVVSGTITADDITSTVQTFTFYNYKDIVIETGAIAITKAQAEGSAALGADTEYRFTITFDNITDTDWKDSLGSSYQVTGDKAQKTFTLKLGEIEKITGIPEGTEYTIKEETPSDGSTLESVTDSLASGTVPTGVGKDTVTISSTNVVSGTVTADDNTSTVQTFTFYNSKEEIIKTGAIAITKAQAEGSVELGTDTEYRFTITFDNITDTNWKNNLDSSYQKIGNTVQKTFTLKVGGTEKITGIPAGTKYTISEAAPTDGSTLQSVTDSLAGGTVPTGIGKDGVTISSSKTVSGTIMADDTTTTIQTFTFYNMKEKTPDPEPTPDPTPDPTPNPTPDPEPAPEPKTTALKITKVDSGDSDITLSGAVFRLEKLTSDGSVDKGFATQELTTPKSGVITFSNLSDGSYRLTETKAPSGYVQLKNPATIVIKDGKYTLENNGEKTITNNTISFIIKNNKQKAPAKEDPPKTTPKETPKSNNASPAKVFSLPKTGGIGTLLYTLIGVACMGGVIVFFYIRKRKKA